MFFSILYWFCYQRIQESWNLKHSSYLDYIFYSFLNLIHSISIVILRLSKIKTFIFGLLYIIMSKRTVKICKRCKTEYVIDTGYPVCEYCLKMLDNWEWIMIRNISIKRTKMMNFESQYTKLCPLRNFRHNRKFWNIR